MKKLIFNTAKAIAFVAIVSMGSAGCLKQYDGLPKDSNNDNPSTLLELVKKDDNHLAVVSTPSSISLEGQPAVETVTLGYLRVASPDLPSSAMNVTLRIDTSAAVLPSGTVALPAAAYTINTALTTAAGVRNNNIQIQLTKASLDPTKTYAIGITVSNPGSAKLNPLGNMLVAQIGVKNKYDGLYRVTGTMVDLTNATLTGLYPLNFSLRTSGLNTIAVYDAGQNTQTHLILSAGATSQYGSFGINMTFDLATNKITSVVNSYGQPASNGRSAALDPSGVNAYDPATKTIKIKYYLLQPGSTIRTTFDETWTYTGPR